MNFKVNDIVLYCSYGVCKIVEISNKNFNDKILEYYVLRPVYDKKSTIYVPVSNQTLTAKMRPILSVEEIYDLVHFMSKENLIWIENETIRKQQYKQILVDGKREQLIQLIKTIYLRQKKLKVSGKRLHITDERFLKEAEKMLYSEFAYVLNIECEQVLPFILEQVQMEEDFKKEELVQAIL